MIVPLMMDAIRMAAMSARDKVKSASSFSGSKFKGFDRISSLFFKTESGRKASRVVSLDG
jgi:hypothetical protein